MRRTGCRRSRAPGGELGDHRMAGRGRDPEVAGQLGEREPLVGAGREGLDQVDEAFGLRGGTGHPPERRTAPPFFAHCKF